MTESNGAFLERRLAHLMTWVEQRAYTGYDLYDGLTITRSQAILENRLANTFLTQSFKRFPINVRPLLGMPETKMPKGVGLFLNAYALLAERARYEGRVEQEAAYLARCETLVEWLMLHACKGYSGYCWNFGFPYKFLFETPTVVITAMVARGLFDYYRLTQREEIKRILRSICDFILEDLLLTETDYGICLSYTPKDNTTRPKLLNCCYNASMLGAEVLARVYALTGEEQLHTVALRAVDFTVHHQHDDGRWNYSVDPETGRERAQVDFHQGFVLDSLQACLAYTGASEARYVAALERGVRFYRREQFAGDGRALWRLPKQWPADIHCQAQGILTFSKLQYLDDDYRRFAEQIAHWTMAHMQDKEGYFYYRKGRYMTNKIPYMRWAQAWMMLALAELLNRSGATPETLDPLPLHQEQVQ